MNRWYFVIILSCLLFICCSKYRSGDVYNLNQEGDSLNYVITDRGSGAKISAKAQLRKIELEYKGNSCNITYLTDSAALQDIRGVLLQNTMLPGIKDDVLTKGYFGTFTSKQMVTILLVSFEDFDTYLKQGSPTK